MFKSVLTASLLVVSALAAAVPRALPSGTVTCGSNKYTVAQVSAAVAQGYKYESAGTTVGSSACPRLPFTFYGPDAHGFMRFVCSDSYPHAYNNYEGLSLYCSGSSWFEVRSVQYVANGISDPVLVPDPCQPLPVHWWLPQHGPCHLQLGWNLLRVCTAPDFPAPASRPI